MSPFDLTPSGEHVPPEVRPEPGSPEALRDSAVEWAKRGFRVFPLIPNKKTPLWDGWRDIASKDPATVRAWWTNTAFGTDQAADYNIGYLTDDFLVVDLDTKHGPQAADYYQDELFLDPQDTLAVVTPSGGLHCIYYGQNAKSSVGSPDGKTGIAPYIDIRGVGGLAVAPGSVINGKLYQIIHDVPIKQAPLHLAQAAGYSGPRVQRQDTPVIDLDTPLAWLQAEALVRGREAPQEGGRDAACFQLALDCRDVGLSQGSTENLIARDWADRCSPPFPPDEVAHAVNSAYSYGQNAPGVKNAAVLFGGSPVVGMPGAAAAAAPAAQDLTEFELLELFLPELREKTRFDTLAGQAHHFNGSAWIPSRDVIYRIVQQGLVELSRESGATGDLKARLESKRLAETLEGMAKRHSAIAFEDNEYWNPDDFLTGTPGGTLDLHFGSPTFGKIIPADPADRISQLTSVTPREGARCSEFERVIFENFEGDTALIRHVQKVCFWFLTGDVSLQRAWFLLGDGETGKSLLLEALRAVMGDYGASSSMDVFMASPGGFEKHTTGLADLRRIRMVTVSETPRGFLGADQFKKATGGERLKARHMRQDNVEWMPHFKLLIATNEMPEIQTLDHAIKRRIEIIPMNHRPAVKDRDLLRRWKADPEALAGILQWMIEGGQAYLEDKAIDEANADRSRDDVPGMIAPAAVVEATRGYFRAQNPIGRWISEDCTRERQDTGSDPMRETPSALLASYNSWALRNKLPTRTDKIFKAWLDQSENADLQRKIIHGKTWIYGVRINNPFPTPQTVAGMASTEERS